MKTLIFLTLTALLFNLFSFDSEISAKSASLFTPYYAFITYVINDPLANKIHFKRVWVYKVSPDSSIELDKLGDLKEIYPK